MDRNTLARLIPVSLAIVSTCGQDTPSSFAESASLSRTSFVVWHGMRVFHAALVMCTLIGFLI
jgi:hypothetical protein